MFCAGGTGGGGGGGGGLGRWYCEEYTGAEGHTLVPDSAQIEPLMSLKPPKLSHIT